MHCKAIVFQAVNSPALAEVEIPPLGEGEVLVRTTLSCISPGTELRCAAGLQGGPEAFPFVPGYALVGTVVESGSGVSIPLGTRVFAKGTRTVRGANAMWGGHIEFAVVREAELVPVPEGLGDAEAALGALGGIAHRGLTASDPGPTDDVAIVGLGPLGQLSARLFATRARRVAACDRLDLRVEAARRGGVAAFVATDSPAEALRPIFPEGADIVVDVTGSARAFAGALAATRSLPWTETRGRGPKLIVQGSYPGEFAVPYDAAFHRELTMLFPRDRTLADIAAFFTLLADGRLDVRGIVGAEYARSEAASAYAALAAPAPTLLTAAFRWT